MHGEAPTNAGHIALYESDFYQRLLSEARIPGIHQKSKPKDIFSFLRDIANDYISKIK